MKNVYQLFVKSFAIIAFLVIPLMFYGQETKEETKEQPKKSIFAPYWFLHGDLGVTDYHGTIAKNKFAPDFEKINIGGNLSFGRQFSPVIGLEAEFFRGFLTGQKDDYNQYFKADEFETSLLGSINLSNLIGGYKSDRTVTIDAVVGIGAMQYWARLYDMNTDNQIAVLGREDSPEKYDYHIGLLNRRLVGVLPVGLGFNFALSDKFDLNLDWRYKFVDTKLLDGNSRQPGTIKRDMYDYLGLGATYKFGMGASLKKMSKDFELITLKADPEVLKEKGNKVDVTIKGRIPEKYMNKKSAILVQPILKYEGGEELLEPITLKGEEVIGEGEVINSKTGGSFSYSQQFDYTPEMKNSELVVNTVAYEVKEKLFDNADEIKVKAKYVELGERKLADGVIYTSERIYPEEAEIEMGYHGYEEVTVVSESAKIFFKVNLYNLNWNLPLNKKESTLNALENMWDFIKKDWEIKNIEIDGWASPEGEETFNENLSANRAERAHKYTTKKFKRLSWGRDAELDFDNPDEQIDFIIKHHGPDWKGFMNGVEKSDIKDKNVILNVIRSAGAQEKKEQEIRNMILIYPEIEDNILKPLRRSIMTVNCFEPKRTKDNIAELSTTYPDSLEMEELLYAATMTDDHGTKLMIYESVIELYPDNWQALNNAAVIKMKQGKYAEAAILLEKAQELAPNNGKICNNLGVLALKMGDYEDAEEMFNKAQSLGVKANYNLALVEIEKGNYDQALNLMGTEQCNYNLGLAQLVAEEYDKAEETLKCTEDNMGETYYLLAIVGARTNNSSMMYEYLTKAIQENPSLKSEAKDDKEFLEYENNPDFKALVE